MWTHSSYLQRIFQSVVQFHDGRLVSTAVAVVWSTEDGHHVLVMAPVVALQEQTCQLDWDTSDQQGALLSWTSRAPWAQEQVSFLCFWRFTAAVVKCFWVRISQSLNDQSAQSSRDILLWRTKSSEKKKKKKRTTKSYFTSDTWNCQVNRELNGVLTSAGTALAGQFRKTDENFVILTFPVRITVEPGTLSSTCSDETSEGDRSVGTSGGFICGRGASSAGCDRSFPSAADEVRAAAWRIFWTVNWTSVGVKLGHQGGDEEPAPTSCCCHGNQRIFIGPFSPLAVWTRVPGLT